MSRVKIAIAVLVVLGAGYCAVTPAPTMIHLDYPLGAGATAEVSRAFWAAFGANDVEAIAPAACEDDPGGDPDGTLVCRLLAASRAAPDDPTVPMLGAGAYLWRVQTGRFPATRLRDLRRAADLAETAAGHGNRYAPGFQASAEWLLAILTDDQKLGTHAADLLKENTHRWAAFQGFIEMEQFSTRLAPDQELDDADFAMARKAYGTMMASCLLGDWTPGWVRLPARLPINHFIMNTTWLAIHLNGERLCWNNEPAPFSVPGTFVVAGDMHLKQGARDTARVLYTNSTKAPGYEAWSYKDLPVERLADLAGFEKAFKSDSGRVLGKDPKRSMAGQSSFYCVMCHASASAPH